MTFSLFFGKTLLQAQWLIMGLPGPAKRRTVPMAEGVDGVDLDCVQRSKEYLCLQVRKWQH